MKNYVPDKKTRLALLRLENKIDKLQTDLNILLDVLDSQTKESEYSSDVHQLLDSTYKSIESAYLTLNIVNHGIYNKLWINDNWEERSAYLVD